MAENGEKNATPETTASSGKDKRGAPELYADLRTARRELKRARYVGTVALVGLVLLYVGLIGLRVSDFDSVVFQNQLMERMRELVPQAKAAVAETVEANADTMAARVNEVLQRRRPALEFKANAEAELMMRNIRDQLRNRLVTAMEQQLNERQNALYARFPELEDDMERTHLLMHMQDISQRTINRLVQEDYEACETAIEQFRAVLLRPDVRERIEAYKTMGERDLRWKAAGCFLTILAEPMREGRDLKMIDDGADAGSATPESPDASSTASVR